MIAVEPFPQRQYAHVRLKRPLSQALNPLPPALLCEFLRGFNVVLNADLSDHVRQSSIDRLFYAINIFLYSREVLKLSVSGVIALPFKELISFLVTRSIGTRTDAGKIILSQDDFADKYGFNRATLGTWLKGSETPSLGTMQTVIKGEGFEVKECIQVPESIRLELRQGNPDIFKAVEEIVLNGGSERVFGLHRLLIDVAIAATAERRIDKRKMAKQGSSANKERKKRNDPLKKKAG